MGRSWRWLLSGVLAVLVFLAATWIVTKYLPASWLKDSNGRLSVGCGAGVAIAALVALWGKDFAAPEPDKSITPEPERSNKRAVVVRGSNTGIANAGDRARNSQSTGSMDHGAQQEAKLSSEAPEDSDTAGTWVRISGNNDGIASAGDDTTNTQDTR